MCLPVIANSKSQNTSSSTRLKPRDAKFKPSTISPTSRAVWNETEPQANRKAVTILSPVRQFRVELHPPQRDRLDLESICASRLVLNSRDVRNWDKPPMRKRSVKTKTNVGLSCRLKIDSLTVVLF